MPSLLSRPKAVEAPPTFHDLVERFVAARKALATAESQRGEAEALAALAHATMVDLARDREAAQAAARGGSHRAEHTVALDAERLAATKHHEARLALTAAYQATEAAGRALADAEVNLARSMHAKDLAYVRHGNELIVNRTRKSRDRFMHESASDPIPLAFEIETTPLPSVEDIG
jgi:hypothetical protein